MAKPKFNPDKIEKFLQNTFPNSRIIKYSKFSEGLVSPTYKLEIQNPKKTIVIKLSKLKNKSNIHKNNLILNYLNQNKIPSPKVHYEKEENRKLITVMEFIGGNVASKNYESNTNFMKRKILFNAGRNLKKIHNLKIQSFWKHQKHEIKNKTEWKKWTDIRIQKYLKFFEKKLNKYYQFLERELTEFSEVLSKHKIDFVPLHWDYHLSNINVDKNGEIIGTFDFDNAMKGDPLADIGQIAYCISLKQNDYKNFDSFLKGYKSKFTKDELKLIRGYFLLHILAVSRTIWFKKRLDWIIKDHKRILDEFLEGKI